jgi:hypothetical protein
LFDAKLVGDDDAEETCYFVVDVDYEVVVVVVVVDFEGEIYLNSSHPFYESFHLVNHEMNIMMMKMNLIHYLFVLKFFFFYNIKK